MCHFEDRMSIRCRSLELCSTDCAARRLAAHLAISCLAAAASSSTAAAADDDKYSSDTERTSCSAPSRAPPRGPAAAATRVHHHHMLLLVPGRALLEVSTATAGGRADVELRSDRVPGPAERSAWRRRAPLSHAGCSCVARARSISSKAFETPAQTPYCDCVQCGERARG